jgi:hypothetical protein
MSHHGAAFCEAAPGALASLLYGMKWLIAVSADKFLFTGIDRQILCFKGNSAEQNLIGIGLSFFL